MAKWIWKKYSSIFAWEKYSLKVISYPNEPVSQYFEFEGDKIHSAGKKLKVENGKLLIYENTVFNKNFYNGTVYYKMKNSEEIFRCVAVQEQGKFSSLSLIANGKEIVNSENRSAYPEDDTLDNFVYKFIGIEKGSFIEEVIADENAYTDNARNSDGYWYVRDRIANIFYNQNKPVDKFYSQSKNLKIHQENKEW